VLLKWSCAASSRGWYRLSGILLELDCKLSGLGGAAKRIRKDQERRRAESRVHTVFLQFGGML
jgi:hypothetical protein